MGIRSKDTQETLSWHHALASSMVMPLWLGSSLRPEQAKPEVCAQPIVASVVGAAVGAVVVGADVGEFVGAAVGAGLATQLVAESPLMKPSKHWQLKSEVGVCTVAVKPSCMPQPAPTTSVRVAQT